MEIKEILQKWSKSNHPVENRFYNWENMISFAKHYKQHKLDKSLDKCSKHLEKEIIKLKKLMKN